MRCSFKSLFRVIKINRTIIRGNFCSYDRCLRPQGAQVSSRTVREDVDNKDKSFAKRALRLDYYKRSAVEYRKQFDFSRKTNCNVVDVFGKGEGGS